MVETASFKDHFSGHASEYARYRPSYPDALFDHFAAESPRTALAWDCATGNGQAAVRLAERFDKVVATDASAEQIRSAIPHPEVEYRVAPAEASGLDAASVDLVTVGQALHWFDLERFFAETERVLTCGGVLAAWSYGLCTVTESVDALVHELYEPIVGEFWPPERRIVEAGYADVDFPGSELDVPSFDMTLTWTAADMLGYLRTWSACKRYEQAHGDDPVSMISPKLVDAWGAGERTVRWPLVVRACKLEP